MCEYVYCLLPTAYCRLPTAYCLLPTADCLLPTADCLLPTAYCRLPTAYCRLSAHLWVEEAVDPARQQVASLGQGRVQQREAAALPEGVAAVDELVGPPLEPPLARHLSVREPVGHQIQLE